MAELRPGPRNSLTDVAGLAVGNAQDPKARTGTTVILCTENRAVAAVDVQGGGPGTRETDALAPGRLVESVDAVVLSGGSAFGLDAAGAVAAWLAPQQRGFYTGEAYVPIVPSAILYDLGNGGDKTWRAEPPYRDLGLAAAEAAGQDFNLGKAGAGYGARAGSLEGGLGSASIVDPDTGATVAALVAVNSFGEVITRNGAFFATPFEIENEFGGKAMGSAPEPPNPTFPKLENRNRAALERENTTIAVVATDAKLNRVDTQRMTVMAQAGLARAIRPVFTPFDGDTVFGLASGYGPAVDVIGLARLGALAADCLSRAVARAVFEAEAFDSTYPSWKDRFQS